MEREKNAVNSEYQLYLKDDDWRASAVEKQVMSQTHPGARFSVGSLDTLSGDVRTDLVEFYRTHYSADQMALVVLGSQSLDQLQAWVTEKFSADSAPADRQAGADRTDVRARRAAAKTDVSDGERLRAR